VLIVAYDLFHKGNPLSPVIMGACRALVYASAAAAMTGAVPGNVAIAALALIAYVAGSPMQQNRKISIASATFGPC